MYNKRLSSVVEGGMDSPANSETTLASDFSALASGKKMAVSSETPGLERRITLGERSLAALTSGVADSGTTAR